MANLLRMRSRRRALVPTDRRAVPLGGQIAQEMAIAALLGGNLFGRLAMNPALGDVSDAAERGRVLNRTWRRYGTVNSAALAALVGGWLTTRRAETALPLIGARRRLLVQAKDVAVGAVVVTGLASAAGGVGFAQQAPSGAVPMTSGNQAAPEASDRAAALKRLVNALGAVNLGAELTLVTINALLLRSDFRYFITG